MYELRNTFQSFHGWYKIADLTWFMIYSHDCRSQSPADSRWFSSSLVTLFSNLNHLLTSSSHHTGSIIVKISRISTLHHQELVSATTAGVCSPSTPLSAASRVPWCSTAVSSAGTWTMISTRRSALSWARLVSSSLINSGQHQALQASAMFLRSKHDALACKEISI